MSLDTSGPQLETRSPAEASEQTPAVALPDSALEPVPQCGHEQRLQGAQRRRFNMAVIKFVCTWLAFVVALIGVALLTNLEWARPKVEQAMDDCFHRNVKLGRISWTLGLNGLSIWTDRLSMRESNGQPFIIAGESEIGVAFLPLVEKKVIVKHVEFHHPEVYATQLAPGKWNFSDLLVEGPEIHYVEVDDGILHLRNQISPEQLAQSGVAHGVFANTNWRSYDFQAVAVKLIFPKKHQQRPWPFYLAFKLPRENQHGKYVTDVSLTALCNGPFEDWQHHKCEVEFRADRVNPDDWRPFMQIPNTVSALFGVNFKGAGVPADCLRGAFAGHAQDIAVVNGQQTLFCAPEALCTAQLSLSGKRVEWDSLNLEIGGLNMQSHGAVGDWQAANPHYNAVIAADLKKVSDLAHNSFWRFLPGLNQKPKPDEMSGAAQVEVKMEGDATTQTVSTSLKADGLPLAHLLGGDAGKSAPFLSLFKIEPNVPIKGQVLIDKANGIALNNVEIPVSGTSLHINGTINSATNEHHVEISAKDLPLDRFDTAELEAGKSPSLLLSGKVDLDAKIDQHEQRRTLDVKAGLKNASVFAGKNEIAGGLKGNVHFDGSRLQFDKVCGQIDNKNGSKGTVTLDGSLATSSRGPASLTMLGESVDIGQLVAFCRSAHLPLPAGAVGNMSGMAQSVEIKLSGNAGSPQLALAITPSDMAYQFAPPKGMSLKPLKITGGTIVLTANRLELRDLPVTAQTGKLTMSGTFVGAGEWLAPKMVHLKSAGIDVSEVQQYLCSPDLPDQTQKMVSAVVSPLRLSSVSGRSFGDLKVTFGGNPASPSCALDGSAGFTNLSGKFFQQQIPFDHFSGVVSVSSDELSFSDLSVMSGSSHISAQGTVRNIQRTPVWNLQVVSQFKPEDIVRCLPGDMNRAFSASAGSLLNMKATIIGDNNSERIAFNARALPGAQLTVQGPFGGFKQPAQAPIAVDGTLLLRSSSEGGQPQANSLQLENCKLAVGDAVFQGTGKYAWTDNPGSSPNIDFVVTTPNAVPAHIVVAALVPGIDPSGTAGSIKGTIAASGTPDSLLTHGDVAINGLAVPAWNIKDLDGRLHSPHWNIGSNGSGGNQSQMQVEIPNATLSGMRVHNISGTLVLDAGDQPKVSLNGGTAQVAGGQVKMTAWYTPTNAHYHLDCSMDNLQVDQFITDLIEHSGEVTGLLDGKITLDSSGTEYRQLVSNLQGHGELSITKGSVPKVAQLQERLTAANLIQQGIFGFNINNVLQTMLPVKAGKFKDVETSFDIANGVVGIDRLSFDGNDLRLRAAGVWNLPLNTINMEVAGNIPRVASSLLPGAVGEVSRNFTLQKAVRVVTFHALESFPTVPILGDIGADDPRAFMFKVAGSLNTPNAVQQSISKSFHWLPNKPNASAHPVPWLPASG